MELLEGERVFGDYEEGVLEDYTLSEEDMDFIQTHDMVVCDLWGKVEGQFRALRHVDGAAAGIGLSVFNIVVEVNAVTSDCCQFHRGCLLSGSVRRLRRMLEKRTISGRAADLKNSAGTLL